MMIFLDICHTDKNNSPKGPRGKFSHGMGKWNGTEELLIDLEFINGDPLKNRFC